nr:unnamed protein product [Spirometra erinaceieuropaei]
MTNLLQSLQSWTQALEDRHAVHIAFIDFQKAFDTVPHQSLLHTLKKIGIGGNFLKWIENFLVGRHQVLCIGRGKSDPAIVDSGVPQGSVLGSILFLIYVDDAARDLDCEVAMFADDMKIWSVIRGPDDEDRPQMNLNRLEEWSNRWLLRFNVAKIMHTSPRQHSQIRQHKKLLSGRCSPTRGRSPKEPRCAYDEFPKTIRPLFEGGKNRNVRTEPVLFVIRKQQRLSTTLVTPIAYYYIVNGTVIQAPDLATLVNARLHTVIHGLNKTIQALAPCARYHPPDGSYSWDDPKKLLGRSTSNDGAPEGNSPDKDAKTVQKSESNVATNYYQVHPMEVLLAEWASRFPLPPLPTTATTTSSSTVQTPQQPSANTPQTQSGPLTQHATSGREHDLKSASGIPEKKSRLL